jgi:transposase
MDFFSARGHHCNEIHAFKIKRYKQTVLNLNKTDKIDAKEIANYARRYADLLKEPYVARTGELLELGLLLRMTNQIMKRDISFSNIHKAYGFLDENRVEGLDMSYSKKALDFIINYNSEHRKNFKKGLKEFTSDKFKEVYTCLESIPGIGEATIPHLIYHTNDFSRFKNGRDFGAYAGLVPNFHDSGISVNYNTKIANRNMCNNNLRAVMSQAGSVAMRYNPQCMDLVARMSDKKWKQQLIASTRKLAIQIHFCGKNRVMYDKKA